MFAYYYDPWTPYYMLALVVGIILAIEQMRRVYKATRRISWGWLACGVVYVACLVSFSWFPPIARVRDSALRDQLTRYDQAARSDDAESRRYGIEGLCEVIRGCEQEFARDTAFDTLIAVNASEAIPFLDQLRNDPANADLQDRALAALDKIKPPHQSSQENR